MLNLLAFGVILAVAEITWLIRLRFKLPLCPICIGVSTTWLWLLVVRYLGQSVDSILIALLMGGSVVGVSYILERRLPANKSAVVWKIFSITSGFALVYGALSEQWLLAIIGAVIAVSVGTFFFWGNEATTKTTTELEEKMKDCC